MTHVSERLRHQVRDRAQGKCEYCLLHGDDAIYPHEPDHIVAEKHNGATTLDNLAWACFLCNRFKGSDLASIDPATNQPIYLFNPRTQQWKRHFRLHGARIDPLTACGRATAFLLHFNTPTAITERLKLIATGRYPQ